MCVAIWQRGPDGCQDNAPLRASRQPVTFPWVGVALFQGDGQIAVAQADGVLAEYLIAPSQKGGHAIILLRGQPFNILGIGDQARGDVGGFRPAHHLHMVDALEIAYAFGLRIRPRAGQDDNLKASITFDPYKQADFDTIIEAWIPMTFAVNSINRSMGIDDLYPFVISPEVTEKLKVVHDIVKSYA